MNKPYGPYSDQVEAFIESIDDSCAHGYGDHYLEREAGAVWYDAAHAIRIHRPEEFEAARDTLVEQKVCSILAERAIGAIVVWDYLADEDADLLLRPFHVTFEQLSAAKKAQAAA